jgi:hypothetical protein
LDLIGLVTEAASILQKTEFHLLVTRLETENRLASGYFSERLKQRGLYCADSGNSGKTGVLRSASLMLQFHYVAVKMSDYFGMLSKAIASHAGLTTPGGKCHFPP